VDTGKDEEMRIAYPSLRVSTRATLTFFLALLVGAIALLSLGTRPAETKPTTAKPLYTVQDLGTLGGSFSAAHNINDAGKVVGYSATRRDAEEHPFLYSGGKMRDLTSLIPASSGWKLMDALAINDNGYIVGRASTKLASSMPSF
jgi:probable HAF family extracellular repeat protein